MLALRSFRAFRLTRSFRRRFLRFDTPSDAPPGPRWHGCESLWLSTLSGALINAGTAIMVAVTSKVDDKKETKGRQRHLFEVCHPQPRRYSSSSTEVKMRPEEQKESDGGAGTRSMDLCG